ncbi:unnamed protein product [Owenia fusiformis]|uniref:UDP-galactose transporter n=1 Tax=Owenia fusiformis TaxID=6347 RepID=A0A8S4NR69_OWEFU|nr:unnamed protein product [Owenia fusiformis]
MGEGSNLELGSKHATTPEEQKRPFNPIVWRLLLLVGVLMYGSYSILIHLCKVDGKLPFSTASMVLMTETAKICISMTMFLPEVRENGFPSVTIGYALAFSVPAIIYAINNNIAAVMQLHMDPATFQVLSNMKILSTAVLYRLIIKKPVSNIQWVALFMLAFAGVANSWGSFESKPGDAGSGVVHITFIGVVLIIVQCTFSGLAGVYSEYILKKNYQTSIHLQNIMLYTFGIMLNGGAWVVDAVHNDRGFNLFQGYSTFVWISIIMQALCGLIMSAIFKHGNNITRLFVVASAMVVTTTLSMLIFGLQLNGYFIIAFLMVSVALILYHNGDKLCQNAA